jgi:hypothetical protein
LIDESDSQSPISLVGKVFRGTADAMISKESAADYSEIRHGNRSAIARLFEPKDVVLCKDRRERY